MTKICAGPCSRERFLNMCECEDCLLYASVLTGGYYPPNVLGVMGLIAAIYAWREWLADAAVEYMSVEWAGIAARARNEALEEAADLFQGERAEWDLDVPDRIRALKR